MLGVVIVDMLFFVLLHFVILLNILSIIHVCSYITSLSLSDVFGRCLGPKIILLCCIVLDR